jgi:hypothetical protein
MQGSLPKKEEKVSISKKIGRSMLKVIYPKFVGVLEYWSDGVLVMINNKSQISNNKQIIMTQIRNPKRVWFWSLNIGI